MDLHPAGADDSIAYATTGSQQAGEARFGNKEHAGIWFGTAGSFVDLNPAGASGSALSSTIGSLQAGAAQFGAGAEHAGIWSGTAESFVDLDPSLGGDYGASDAMSIWTDGSTVLVAGYADHIPSGRTHAILWTITVPEPSSSSLILMSMAGLGILRRHRK